MRRRACARAFAVSAVGAARADESAASVLPPPRLRTPRRRVLAVQQRPRRAPLGTVESLLKLSRRSLRSLRQLRRQNSLGFLRRRRERLRAGAVKRRRGGVERVPFVLGGGLGERGGLRVERGALLRLRRLRLRVERGSLGRLQLSAGARTPSGTSRLRPARRASAPAPRAPRALAELGAQRRLEVLHHLASLALSLSQRGARARGSLPAGVVDAAPRGRLRRRLQLRAERLERGGALRRRVGARRLDGGGVLARHLVGGGGGGGFGGGHLRLGLVRGALEDLMVAAAPRSAAAARARPSALWPTRASPPPPPPPPRRISRVALSSSVSRASRASASPLSFRLCSSTEDAANDFQLCSFSLASSPAPPRSCPPAS